MAVVEALLAAGPLGGEQCSHSQRYEEMARIVLEGCPGKGSQAVRSVTAVSKGVLAACLPPEGEPCQTFQGFARDSRNGCWGPPEVKSVPSGLVCSRCFLAGPLQEPFAHLERIAENAQPENGAPNE